MNTLRFLLATLLLAAGHALSANQPATSAQNMAASEVMDLRVEMERSPVGLDTARPRFSWKLKPQAGKRGQMQTAYRLVLGTNRNGFDSGEGRVFDSGKVESNACVLVDLLREDLQPATDYHWTVKVWDENGLEGGFAPIAKFATGYFDKKFWDKDGAMWIESPVARRDTESVEIWIRHACSNVRGTLKSDAKPGGLYDRYRKLVTDEEVEKYARDMSDSMKRRIWSASLLRKEFSVAKVAKARLYICGLGYYRAYLNGKMVGDRVLAPSDSDFFANAYYNVFDVTDQINKKSENCLGIELATGRWWSSPGNFPQQYHERPVVIARLELTDSNGQTKAIVTDTTWQAGEHGILRSSFWIGELFDANRYPQGWDTPGFNASEWLPAKPAGKYPQGEMLRDPMPPECIVEYCDPVAVSEPLPGIYVYDFGKQITGRVRLKLDHLAKGQEIVLRYAEIKTGDAPQPVPTALAWYPDFNNDRQLPGMLQFKRRGSVASEYPLWYGGKDGRERGNLGSYQIGGGHLYTDMYVASGKGLEAYEPKFTYTGFRYVEVLGLKKKPPVGAVQAFRLRTDPEFVGTLSTDNARLNKVLAGTRASLMANYHSHYQDNPGSERNGFIINEGFNIDNSALWFNMYPQLTKVTQGIFCRHEKYGFYPSTYTGMRHMEWFKERFFHLSSATAYPQIAEGLVAYYNDQRKGKQFALMLTDWVRELCEHTYWEHDHDKGSGEHQAEDSLGIYPKAKRTRAEVINRSFFKAAWIMYAGHKTAALLTEMGHPEEAVKVSRYLTVFNDRVLNDPKLKLYDSKSGLWDPDAFARMGSDNLTLLGDLQPRQTDAELVKRIAAEMNELGYMTIGVKSVYNLLSTVTQGGYADIAAAILQREEYPSLLYSIAQTGGTVGEGWNQQHSYAQVEGMASVGKWFYRDLVGINPSIAKPAFGRFELRPHVPIDVRKFEFAYDSPRGLIESHWNADGERVVWSVTVPPNAVAEVFVPGQAVQSDNEEGVSLVRSEKDRQVFQVGSGKYTFRFTKISSQR